MSKIEFNCSACSTLLRVDESAAGKKARCPKCNMVHDVPGGQKSNSGLSQSPASDVSEHASQRSSEKATHVFGGTWELRSSDGQVYGPVDRQELDEWAAEGRVSASCYLRQQNGEWFPAEQIYPQVSGAHPTPTQSRPHFVGDEANFAGAHSQAGHMPISSNPYAGSYTPVTGQHFAQANLRPNNGVAILVCGIVGICCFCGIFSIVAWVMAANDLAAMKNGTMSTQGRGLVVAGYSLGVVGVILTVLYLTFTCLTR